MRRHHYESIRIAAACLLLSLLAQPLLAQRPNTPSNRPIPRLSDGHISFAIFVEITRDDCVEESTWEEANWSCSRKPASYVI